MRHAFLAISALALSSGSLAPAPAHALTLEERDAIFLACMEARGYTDEAAVICYQAAYGNETTGGGGPNQIPTPPQNDCRSREFECTYR
jgi:hypothetical protein